MGIRAGNVPHLKTDYSDPIAGCHYSVGGFTFLKDDLVMIIQGHPVTESGKKIGAVCSDKYVQMLGLGTIEKIARNYASERSDDQIFSASPEAIHEQTSQGYLCYDILRRLIRIEQKDEASFNYKRPLNIEAMTQLITDALGDKENPFRKDEHREIPIAPNNVLQHYGLWSPPAREEPGLKAA